MPSHLCYDHPQNRRESLEMKHLQKFITLTVMISAPLFTTTVAAFEDIIEPPPALYALDLEALEVSSDIAKETNESVLKALESTTSFEIIGHGNFYQRSIRVDKNISCRSNPLSFAKTPSVPKLRQNPLLTERLSPWSRQLIPDIHQT